MVVSLRVEKIKKFENLKKSKNSLIMVESLLYITCCSQELLTGFVIIKKGEFLEFPSVLSDDKQLQEQVHWLDEYNWSE